MKVLEGIPETVYDGNSNQQEQREGTVDWQKIMQNEDPNEALKQIALKVDREGLPVQEMEDRIEEYKRINNVTVDEMAYYPNGDQVVTAELFWQQILLLDDAEE